MLLHILEMDPPQIPRIFFLFASSTVLVVNALPAFRNRFLIYGSRGPISGSDNARADDEKASLAAKQPTKLLDYLATYRVPHSYFTHFYIASLLSSVFWAFQIVFSGSVFQAISQWSSKGQEGPSMATEQVLLTWFLMTAQGCRRLAESIILAKPSNSTMWFVHWILGIAFYLAMGVSIWVEGLPELRSLELSIELIQIRAPSLRTFLCLPLFLIASGIQHDAHAYLASLPKYTLPKHPIFNLLICPHYTMECLIYLSLSLLAAPKGEIINKTIFSGLLFVIVNLGVTAETSREWYAKKFGAESIRGKWRMVPFVY